jgi:hypothetical protein
VWDKYFPGGEPNLEAGMYDMDLLNVEFKVRGSIRAGLALEVFGGGGEGREGHGCMGGRPGPRAAASLPLWPSPALPHPLPTAAPHPLAPLAPRPGPRPLPPPQDEAVLLRGETLLALTLHWADRRSDPLNSTWRGSMSLEDVRRQARLLHFSPSKPWAWGRSSVRRKAPHAAEAFYEAHELWAGIARQVC